MTRSGGLKGSGLRFAISAFFRAEKAWAKCGLVAVKNSPCGASPRPQNSSPACCPGSREHPLGSKRHGMRGIARKQEVGTSGFKGTAPDAVEGPRTGLSAPATAGLPETLSSQQTPFWIPMAALLTPPPPNSRNEGPLGSMGRRTSLREGVGLNVLSWGHCSPPIHGAPARGSQAPEDRMRPSKDGTGGEQL